MKLYYAPAYCSQAVHIALREAGLEISLVKVDTEAGKLEDGTDYAPINPRGYVPLLELDDGSRHTEVAALLQYVGDLVPDNGLMPAFGSRDRFLVTQWLTFVSSELHKVFSPWLFHKDTADTTRKASKDKLARRFGELERHLEGRDWLVGDAFTVADAYCFTIMSWAPMLGMSLKAYPHLAAYIERIKLRPAVRAALVAEGLVKA
jgi:glutathione S-transferase